MRILLVCAAGMSTSLLVNNMKKVAQEEDTIEAYPVAELNKVIDRFDVVLVGPQVRFKFRSIQEIVSSKGKVTALMDMLAYGNMDGVAMYKQAQDLLGK